MEDLDRASGQLERLLCHREATINPGNLNDLRETKKSTSTKCRRFGRSELHCEHERRRPKCFELRNAIVFESKKSNT